jgi:hypothetical protein
MSIRSTSPGRTEDADRQVQDTGEQAENDPPRPKNTPTM